MNSKRCSALESESALRALVRPPVGRENVPFEIRVLAKAGLARRALEEAHAGVRVRVAHEVVHSFEEAVALRALQPFLLSVPLLRLHVKENEEFVTIRLHRAF